MGDATNDAFLAAARRLDAARASLAAARAEEQAAHDDFWRLFEQLSGHKVRRALEPRAIARLRRRPDTRIAAAARWVAEHAGPDGWADATVPGAPDGVTTWNAQQAGLLVQRRRGERVYRLAG